MHEFKAWHQWVERRRVTYEYIGFVPSGQQVAVRILSVGCDNLFERALIN